MKQPLSDYVYFVGVPLSTSAASDSAGTLPSPPRTARFDRQIGRNFLENSPGGGERMCVHWCHNCTHAHEKQLKICALWLTPRKYQMPKLPIASTHGIIMGQIRKRSNKSWVWSLLEAGCDLGCCCSVALLVCCTWWTLTTGFFFFGPSWGAFKPMPAFASHFYFSKNTPCFKELNSTSPFMEFVACMFYKGLPSTH